MTQHPENKKRAERAADTLCEYWARGDIGERERDLAVQDLLCDLRHYCDKHGLCLGDIDKNAHACYLDELEHPDL